MTAATLVNEMGRLNTDKLIELFVYAQQDGRKEDPAYDLVLAAMKERFPRGVWRNYVIR